MPGSWTSPDRPGARANALVRVAFRGGNRVGVRDYRTFAAQWLACTIPCRRFADTLAGTAARLGADVVVAVGTGVTSRPPRRSRRAAFPHRAPAGSQAWSMFGAWAAHTVSTRGPMPRGTCLIRLCVRGMRRHRPLLPAGSLPSTPSAAAPRGLVRGFIGTMDPSDSSDLPIRLRLLAFPNRPGTALAAAGSRRSPRFRRDPFVRDVASDPGRATVPRITAPHMLPSAIATASAPATSRFSWLNPTPHTIAVYASPWSSPSTAQHSLPGGRYPLPGPDCHRLDRASFAWRTATPSP
jgi:hypothetical protein